MRAIPAFLVGAFAFSAVAMVSCTKQEVQTADAIAVDLTQFVCTVAPDIPGDPAWVPFVCQLVESAENAAQPIVSTIKVKVPASQAAAFKAAHGPRDAGGG